MADIIKMDYGMMDDMSQTFLQSVEQLQDTMQQMQTIATALEDGALLGRGGVAFTDAIRGKLTPAISRLTEKFDELAQDVMAAKEAMMGEDESAQGLF